MAGILPPTVFSLIVYVVMSVGHEPIAAKLPPMERFIVFLFPLVVVPNLWGIWNGLWVVMRRRLPLAVHGGLLPLVNAAVGYLSVRLMNVPITPIMTRGLPISLAISMVAYYLVWKYAVGFLNALVDVD